MSREWKPGDVAMLKLNTRAGKWFRGVRIERCPSHSYYVWQVNGGGISEGAVDEARPVVVIDTRDADQIDALWDALKDGLALRSRANLADALDAFIAPPKPDEPTGLGAVVEDTNGEVWIRAARIAHGWHRPMGTWCTYSEIAAVKVLSEGVIP